MTNKLREGRAVSGNISISKGFDWMPVTASVKAEVVTRLEEAENGDSSSTICR